MADRSNFETLEIFINDNSQRESAADESEVYEAAFRKRREESLRALGKTEQEIQNQLLADKREIEEKDLKGQAEKYKENLEKQIKYGATLQEREDAKRALKLQQSLEKASEAIVDKINSTANNLFNNIKNAGAQYADYVERLEVGLIGSSKNYESVSETLQKVFSMNVFFSLDEALQKTTEMVEKGISYNVELRSSLDVMSEKMAKTFDAFDATLTRLVRIQQQDSTQARLGMESLLQEYLNSNFQNSEYLHGVSDQVSALLLEAESTMSRNEAVEFEYAVQKWLGSLGSVGVSDSTLTTLAEGIGYLASGNVQALASNSSLQQLMALSISKGGGSRSYGDMLLNGISASDVSNIMTGFYNLVTEIGSSNNMVAMSQYARIFNLSMSDITSTLNLTAEEVKSIADNMVSYQETVNRVNDELSVGNLISRTSYAEMVENIKKNTLTAIGLDMSNNVALNLMYEALDQAANLVDMFNLGIEVEPFGVGASTKIDAGALIRLTAASATYMGEWAKNIQGLSSMLSPNLSLLGGEESNTVKLLGGQGTGVTTSGVTQNQATYVGNTDTSAVYQSINQQANQSASEIINMDIDEEKKKMEETQKSMKEIGDNVAFIVELLNVYGIKVRAMPHTQGDIPAVNNSGNDFYFRGGY